LVSQLLGMVDRGRGVDGSRFVSRGSLISGGSLVGRGRGSSILGLARVRHISDISTISISNLVVNSLESAIRKSNRVGSAGGITISVLTSIEVATRVVISNSVVVGVDSGLVSIGRLSGMVGGLSGGVVHWLGRSMVGRGRSVVSRGRCVVSRGRCVVSRGSLVDGSRGVISWGRGMINRGSLVDRGGGMISWGGSVISRGGFVCGNSSRCMDSSHWLLITSVPMDTLGSSVGLATH